MLVKTPTLLRRTQKFVDFVRVSNPKCLMSSQRVGVVAPTCVASVQIHGDRGLGSPLRGPRIGTDRLGVDVRLGVKRWGTHGYSFSFYRPYSPRECPSQSTIGSFPSVKNLRHEQTINRGYKRSTEV